MPIRKTTEQDLTQIETLYRSAKAALKAQGVDQWQEGDYPSAEDARRDMRQGTGYVLEENGELLAAACIAFGREPTYDVIVDGAWGAQPELYGFLHRIAVAPKAKGKNIAGLFFDELKRQALECGVTVLRADTHRDNLPMQRVLEKAGFSLRGVIYVEDGSERLAYELILSTTQATDCRRQESMGEAP